MEAAEMQGVMALPEAFQLLSDVPPDRLYPIRPSAIPLRGRRSAGRFWSAEVERAAGMLVLFFQQRGYWGPFTVVDLVEFYQKMKEDPNTMFYGILGPWFDDRVVTSNPWKCAVGPFVIQGTFGQLYVTDHFVKACCDKSAEPRYAG